MSAFTLDLALGEPPRRLHPTVWMGRLISRLVVSAKARMAASQRAAGILIAAAVVAASAGLPAALYWAAGFMGEWPRALLIVASGAVLLFAAISVRSMLDHAWEVVRPLGHGNVDIAQQRLAALVKRKTSGLGPAHIYSGLVETIAENTVDGMISPLTYFALGGLPGALGYRAVNTMDAMIGYRSEEFREIGWAAAGLDRALNYVPARLGALLIVCAAALLRLDWRGAIRVMRHDHANTQSPNAGYPISAMAGALGVHLEKVGHYVIGAEGEDPTHTSVSQACKVMLISSTIYVGIIAAVSLAMFFLGVSVWWSNA